MLSLPRSGPIGEAVRVNAKRQIDLSGGLDNGHEEDRSKEVTGKEGAGKEVRSKEASSKAPLNRFAPVLSAEF